MSSGRSPWVYVGLGCGLFALAGVICAVGLGFWGVQKAKEFEAELKDPVARTDKTKRVLGVDELPHGYHAMMALTVPFVMEIAMLSDRPPNSEGVVTSFDERGLIYIETIGIAQDESELRDYFEGRTSDSDVLRDNNINIDIDEIINRGVIPRDDGDLMYVTQRGSVSTRGYSGEGITALVLVDCPQDSRSRMAIWFAPDPSPDSPVDELELVGTPADEDELERFMQQFRFCDSS